MVVVACCCCILYRLALMLAPTFAPCVLTFAPYILTFGPCACGVSLLSTGANIPLEQVVVVTSCNLRSWCFFTQPLAQIVHLHTWWYHPLQLALVVLFHPPTGANTALAPGQLALCGGTNIIILYYSMYCNSIPLTAKSIMCCCICSINDKFIMTFKTILHAVKHYWMSRTA